MTTKDLAALVSLRHLVFNTDPERMRDRVEAAWLVVLDGLDALDGEEGASIKVNRSRRAVTMKIAGLKTVTFALDWRQVGGKGPLWPKVTVTEFEERTYAIQFPFYDAGEECFLGPRRDADDSKVAYVQDSAATALLDAYGRCNK